MLPHIIYWSEDMHYGILRYSVAVHTDLIFLSLSHTHTYTQHLEESFYHVTMEDTLLHEITIKNTIISLFLQRASIKESVKVRFFFLVMTRHFYSKVDLVKQRRFSSTILINITKSFMPEFSSVIFQIEPAVVYILTFLFF